LRFPRGILPVDLLEGYDFDDFVTFTRYSDYDILDIHFGEMEAPDEWTNYELGSLIGIRDELMEGDLRSLYITWLASQRMSEGYYDEEDEGDEGDGEENEEISTPPVPPAFGTLTAAQEALAELLQVPQELLGAAAQHSSAATSTPAVDVTAWVPLLPSERRDDYLVRLAHNEPGLSHLLVRELRELSQDKHAEQSTGERVTYSTLLTESKAVKAQLERERREQAQAARQRHLQDIHKHQNNYWHQVDEAVMRGSGTGYDEAAQVLVELREVANHFNETEEFQERFRAWVRPHLRRPAFIKRLQTHKFPLPEA